MNDASLADSMRPFEKACDGGDWQGCGMAALVKSEMKQDGRPVAAKAFPMAMNLEACGPSSMDEYACREALELGTARDQLAAIAARGGSHVQLRRVVGERNIEPAMREAVAMRRSRRASATRAGLSRRDVHLRAEAEAPLTADWLEEPPEPRRSGASWRNLGRRGWHVAC